MKRQVTEFLGNVLATECQSVGGLQVFGLRWETASGLDYKTLDEALASGLLEVSEISTGGTVPLLKVNNRSAEPVFLMAGEQLIGAKQNRVLNVSILVPAKIETAIPVSCVEAGRWQYCSPHFASGGNMSHGKLREMMSRHASEGYKSGAMPFSKQGEVWSEVDRKLAAMHTVSGTHALNEVYEDHRALLADMAAGLQPPRDCFGAAFAVAGRIAGADLFDKPATLVKLWAKLVRAHALDALEHRGTVTGPVTREAVQAWLRSAARAPVAAYKSPGLGQDVRFELAELRGAALVVEEQPVHAEVFFYSGQ